MNLFLLFTAIFCLLQQAVICDKLEDVSDEKLVHLIKSDSFLVVLFSKQNCDDCDKYEAQLLNVEVEFKDALGANIVKASNSQLVRLYSPTKEPALVFFRHGIALLYDGPINEDAIYQKFDDNRMPIVKELSDENFEHLTQASTGATTGDWFIMFYNQECIECQRLSAVWEGVGAALRNRMNIAAINKDKSGRNTAKRFNIRKVPEFIYIRQGKFYRYEIPVYDIKSFVSFAQEFYKNARAEKVVIPASPFDNIVMWCVQLIKTFNVYIFEIIHDHPHIFIFGACGFGLTAITAIIAKCMAKKSKEEKKEKKAE